MIFTSHAFILIIRYILIRDNIHCCGKIHSFIFSICMFVCVWLHICVYMLIWRYMLTPLYMWVCACMCEKSVFVCLCVCCKCVCMCPEISFGYFFTQAISNFSCLPLYFTFIAFYLFYFFVCPYNLDMNSLKQSH